MMALVIVSSVVLRADENKGEKQISQTVHTVHECKRSSVVRRLGIDNHFIDLTLLVR